MEGTLCSNMHPELRLHVKRCEVAAINDLIQSVEVTEEIVKLISPDPRPTRRIPRNGVISVDAQYDRKGYNNDQ